MPLPTRYLVGALFGAFVLGVAVTARAQVPGDRQDVPENAVRALNRILGEEWHPEPTDPAWLQVKREVEAGLAADATGPIAMLARRAAVRVEVGVDPVISITGHTSSFALDTRPWFVLSNELPFVVEVSASLDGGSWMLLASADDGMQCRAKTIDIPWPDEIQFGFHHIKLIADVRFLRPGTTRERHCTFSKGALGSGTPGSPLSEKQVMATERRNMPGISFGLFDTRQRLRLPREANGEWTKADQDQPAYDMFVRAAQNVPVDAIEPGLPKIPFQRWLESVLGQLPIPKDATRRIGWRTEFCNENEAQWYPGDSVGTGYWAAASNARRRPRDLCVIAGGSVLEGAGPGDRDFSIRLKIGILREDEAEWILTDPTFVGGVLESTDSLDVPALSALPTLLRLPLELWPTTDISVTASDISYTPRVPIPGEPVTVKVEIRNLGGRDVPFVHGTLTVRPCCPREQVLRDFHGPIPVGGTMTIEHTLVLPSARALVVVYADVLPLNGGPFGRDRNTEDNAAGVGIGEPVP